ncbi:hypothetical protein IC611_22495 [Proteus mirabilis]
MTPKECEIIASALTAKLLEDNHVFVEQVAKMSHIAYRSLEIALIDFGKFNQFAKNMVVIEFIKNKKRIFLSKGVRLR